MLAANKGFGISTVDLEDILTTYTKAEAEILRWWFLTAKDHNWSLTDLAKRTGVSGTSLSRLFRGLYDADPSKMITRLVEARITFQDGADNPDFILTSLAKRTFAIFDKTRALRNVSLLWGKLGIGKSTVMEEYAKRHPDNTHYFCCDGFGYTTYQFTLDLAKALRIPHAGGQGTHKIRSEIQALLSKGNRLLIIDELHEIFATCDPKHITRICEWLRHLQERTNCGLVLVGTTVLKDHFFKSRYTDVLAQLCDRGTIRIDLPKNPTKGDINAFLKHYDLKFPEKETEELQILNDILSAHGLRMLTLHLRDGQAFANKKDEPYAWKHFVGAFKDIISLNPTT